jgi:hypothetical protein
MRTLLLTILLTLGLLVGCGGDGSEPVTDGDADSSTEGDGDVQTPKDADTSEDADTLEDDQGTTDDADAGTGTGDDVPNEPTELCDNNEDDDNDGDIDCDDDDCKLSEICVPVCKPLSQLACNATVSAQNDDDGSTNVFATYSCEDYLYTGPEVAWTFSVDTPTNVTVLLDNESDDTDVLVIKNANDLCFASQCITSGLESAAFLALPDTSYSLVVDGYQGSIGSFELQVICESCKADCTAKVCGSNGCGGTCGSCGDGQICAPDQSACLSPPTEDVCETAEVINELPFTDLGDSSEAIDNYNALGDGCLDAGTGGGADVVYQFTPSSTDLFQIILSGLTFDAALYVVSDCDNISMTCLGAAESLDDESLSVGLKAGTTYFIIVDGIDEQESGTFQLDVVSLGPCTPQCDGCGNPDGCGGSCPCDAENDTCDEATAINPATLPIEIEGTTNEAADNYSAPEAACPGQTYAYGDGGSDVVYSITPTENAKYIFSIPLAGADFDASLYIVNDCSDIADACVGGSEVIGLGGESVTAALEQGTTYYLIVDGYKANQGNFTLKVALCTASCNGKSCGSDGCGGNCGECGADKSCFEGQCH